MDLPEIEDDIYRVPPQQCPLQPMSTPPFLDIVLIDTQDTTWTTQKHRKCSVYAYIRGKCYLNLGLIFFCCISNIHPSIKDPL